MVRNPGSTQESAEIVGDPPSTLPLAVDLDGTLVRTDILVESLNHAVRNPRHWLPLLRLLAGPRSRLKDTVAGWVDIDPTTLPYRADLLEWLEDQHRAGRQIVLATATHEQVARKISDHLGIFDGVLASTRDNNLKGPAKADALAERFGNGGFEYVGNDSADVPVWEVARVAHVAGSDNAIAENLRRSGKLGLCFPTVAASPVRTIAKALRLHQWLKNLLVFAPLAGAHRFDHPPTLGAAALAFLCFGLVASSVYVLNDLADVDDDRSHPRKRHRPFASGELSLPVGWLLWPLLALTGLTASAILLPVAFTAVLGLYLGMTLAYSFSWKRTPILDVGTLAALYTIRIVAGAFAVAVPLSFWLITISVFLFTSLAYVKRTSELRSRTIDGPETILRGRGYGTGDLPLVTALGSASGMIGVLVLALYINDPVTATLYKTPKLLWLACPLLLHWISRVWLLAHRGEMHDDPVVFAIKDKASWLAGALAAAVFLTAQRIDLSGWVR